MEGNAAPRGPQTRAARPRGEHVGVVPPLPPPGSGEARLPWQPHGGCPGLLRTSRRLSERTVWGRIVSPRTAVRDAPPCASHFRSREHLPAAGAQPGWGGAVLPVARADPARTLQVRFSQRRPERRWRRHGRERGLAHGKRSPVCLRSREETDGGAGRRGRQDGARARGETRFWGRAFGLHVPALASQLCDHCQLLTQSGPRSPRRLRGAQPGVTSSTQSAGRSPEPPPSVCALQMQL